MLHGLFVESLAHFAEARHDLFGRRIAQLRERLCSWISR